MPSVSEVSVIAQVIQLAVAPVFLLTGVSGMLAVMTNRLSRIIDRARALEGGPGHATVQTDSTRVQLGVLARRARLIGRAITLCTTTALLICTVIALLFLSAFLNFDTSIPIGLLFIAAMLTFFLGLLWFLREIFLATASLRIGPS